MPSHWLIGVPREHVGSGDGVRFVELDRRRNVLIALLFRLGLLGLRVVEVLLPCWRAIVSVCLSVCLGKFEDVFWCDSI